MVTKVQVICWFIIMNMLTPTPAKYCTFPCKVLYISMQSIVYFHVYQPTYNHCINNFFPNLYIDIWNVTVLSSLGLKIIALVNWLVKWDLIILYLIKQWPFHIISAKCVVLSHYCLHMLTQVLSVNHRYQHKISRCPRLAGMQACWRCAS